MESIELIDAVNRFSRDISPTGVLGLVPHQPFAAGRVACCLANVYEATANLGGYVHFGWYFLLRCSREFGYYLIATHHAVWQPPGDLELVDVTPFHPDKNQHPISTDREVLFFLDTTAEPLITGTLAIPRPSQFHPLGSDEGLAGYMEQLRDQEREHYRMLMSCEQRRSA